MTDLRSVVVVDPVSSAIHYGDAIQAEGYLAVALISVKELSKGLRRLQRLSEFQHVIYAGDLKSAVDLLSRLNVCAVVPGSDIGVILADELSAYYGLVGNSIRSSLPRVDKAFQKNALINRGVSVALGIEVGAAGIDQQELKLLKYPVVVKPCRGTGSRNVKVCNTFDEVDVSISNIRVNHEARGGEERRILIEEYLAGEEYFAVVANYGVGEAKRLLCFAVYEKQLRQGSPGVYKNIRSLSLDEPEAVLAFSYVKTVNDALGVNFGINDVELKIGVSGPVIIEQNGRLPGASVPKLIGECTGVDCYQLALDIYLGNKPLPVEMLKFERHFCICCLVSDESGIVERIHGLDELVKLESFHMINLYVETGQYVDLTVDFLSSWGMVYLIHESLEVLQLESELVHKTLSLQCQC